LLPTLHPLLDSPIPSTASPTATRWAPKTRGEATSNGLVSPECQSRGPLLCPVSLTSCARREWSPKCPRASRQCLQESQWAGFWRLRQYLQDLQAPGVVRKSSAQSRLPTEQRERIPTRRTWSPRLGQAGRPETGPSAQHWKVHKKIYAQACVRRYMPKHV